MCVSSPRPGLGSTRAQLTPRSVAGIVEATKEEREELVRLGREANWFKQLSTDGGLLAWFVMVESDPSVCPPLSLVSQSTSGRVLTSLHLTKKNTEKDRKRVMARLNYSFELAKVVIDASGCSLAKVITIMLKGSGLEPSSKLKQCVSSAQPLDHL